MAHALKRIAFATCFPDQQQFTFIAREPKATTDEQFCHAFRARSAREVIAVTFVFLFLKYLFLFLIIVIVVVAIVLICHLVSSSVSVLTLLVIQL